MRIGPGRNVTALMITSIVCGTFIAKDIRRCCPVLPEPVAAPTRDTLPTSKHATPPETLLIARPDPNPYGRDFYEGLYPDSIRKYVDSMEPHPIWWWPVDEYGYPLTRDSVEALGIID